MAHTIYDNEVLRNKVTDITNTSIDVFPLMNVDRDLQENAGMKKVINVYTYSGASQKLGKGIGNTTDGTVSFTPKEYTVELYQQRFSYYDEEEMQDPMVVSVGVEGSSKVMANEIRADYFKAVATTSNEVNYTGALNYDAIVDGITAIDVEDESGMFVLINPTQKGELRKDPDFKSVAQGEIIVNGHIGNVAGIPVIVSKLVEDPIVATKEAVTCFFKKESEVESERDANTRKNDLYLRRVCLVALTNETKAVKLKKNMGRVSK